MTIQAAEMAKAMLDRNEKILFKALDGLNNEDLHTRLGPDSNPIGWLMWHLSRVQDNHFSAMEGKEHAWATEGWMDRFDWRGEGSDPRWPEQRGHGHTSDQVAEFQSPDVETLMAYYQAVRTYTNAFLDTLTEADMDRPVPSMAADGSTVPLHDRIEQCLLDTMQHSGQVAFLRGLIVGKGWW
jgi:uncharacterized damage-inducible protein DinB